MYEVYTGDLFIMPLYLSIICILCSGVTSSHAIMLVFAACLLVLSSKSSCVETNLDFYIKCQDSLGVVRGYLNL